MKESLCQQLSTRAEHLVWTETIFLAVISVAAFVGNLSVCYAVYRNQRLRTLPNIFAVALAVSDILISVCSTPFSVVILARGRWIFSSRFCRFQGFAMFGLRMTSLHTMGVIAVSRYFCVVKPAKYVSIFNKRRASMYVAVVWCLALVGSVPPFLFENGGYKFQPGKAMCMYTFYTNIAYTAFIECVYIATPLTLITICYGKVFYAVSRSNQVFSHDNSTEQLRANVEEAKVTKTLATVMAGFAFCWLPICIMDYIDAARGEPTLPRQVYLAYGFSAYLSSTINPFEYAATNRQFRREYKNIWGNLLTLTSKCFGHSNLGQNQTTENPNVQTNEVSEL